MKAIKTIEIIFDGTPAEFGVMAEEFGSACIHQLGRMAFSYSGNIPQPEENPVLVFVGIGGHLYARAHRLPKGRSRVAIMGEEETWATQGQYWNLLFAEMQRQGWVNKSDSDEIGQEKEEIVIQEDKTQPKKPKGGRKQIQSHRDALQRLYDKQPRQSNFTQWKTEYETETGIDPEHTESGAWELHRSMVWRKYRPDETQKSTG
jgi:hypothetical protein